MNITLIGMAGVGKSIIGEELAKKLNCKFLDIDEIIENKTGLKLQQIIDDFGDEELVKIEEKAILELGKLNNYVISPGGSVIYSQKTMEFLKRNSVIVFLNASFRSIQKRLTNQDRRGIVGLKKNNLKDLFNKRLPLYKKYADIVIEVPDSFKIDSVIEQILKSVKNPENNRII